MKKYLTLFLLLFLTAAVSAQEGVAEMNQAAGDIGRMFFSMEDLCYVIAAIIAIFGSIRVYYKWQRGREEITFDLLAWGGSCLFILIMPKFLSLLFGIN
ncbi:MAG: DUF4134 domain-containing protein [Sphingobacteriaceae bacterium]|nr:MAG: DUF4134 domain-containing protein [Sphingobacteriaceae bacterium]